MNIVIGLTPLVSNTVMSGICPTTKSDGANLAARPPSYVFSIVWTTLFVLLGIAWVRTRNSSTQKNDKLKTDVLFSLTTISFITWQYFNNCKRDKKLALYNIVISWTLSLLTMIVSQEKSKSGALVAPTVGWLFLASMLNYSQVNENK